MLLGEVFCFVKFLYFLIDYENVNYAGPEGTESLEKGDTISFFYSDKCDKIISYRMKDIGSFRFDYGGGRAGRNNCD